jgi:hypothetical protein
MPYTDKFINKKIIEIKTGDKRGLFIFHGQKNPGYKILHLDISCMGS